MCKWGHCAGGNKLCTGANKLCADENKLFVDENMLCAGGENKLFQMGTSCV